MKLLPLLDAYQAPYKDKFCFWTSLMLVVRSILLVGYGLNILGDPDINHLLIVTALSILLCCTWFTGIVYKNTAFNILETSFILNLIILSGWTMYSMQTCIKWRLKQWTNCFSMHKYWSCIHYLHLYYLLPHLPLPQVHQVTPAFQETQCSEGTEKVERGGRRL